MERIRGRDPLDERKLEWLGRHAGLSYGRHGGKEYAVAGFAVEEGSYSLKPGEVFVRRHRDVRLEDGEMIATPGLYVGMPVEPGTWQRLARSRPKPSGEPRTWDALAQYRRTSADARRIPLRQPSADVGALKAELGADGSASAWLELGAPGVADASPAGLVDYLSRRGISLSLARGRLVARSARPLNIADVQLMQLAEPLLIGALGGPKPMCSECAAEATTIVLPRAPMCSEHAQ
jgi:hypothetical protein